MEEAIKELNSTVKLLLDEIRIHRSAENRQLRAGFNLPAQISAMETMLASLQSVCNEILATVKAVQAVTNLQ